MSHLLPLTASGWVVQVLLSSIAALVLISLAEYVFHRYLMHQGLPERVYRAVPPLKRLLYAHRDLHHKTYYQQFDYEPDPVGRETNLRIALWHSALGAALFIPYFVLTTWYLSLVPTLVFCAVAIAENLIWNTVHREMHQPQRPFWARSWAYRYLAQHHYLHHKNTRANFNIVLPGADVVFGTRSYAGEEDRAELERLGFTT